MPLTSLSRMAASLQARIERLRTWLGSRPWLGDGLLLSTTVATVSLTSALGFSSAVVRVEVAAPPTSSAGGAGGHFHVGRGVPYFLPSSSAGASVSSTSESVSWPLLQSWACHECRALRLAAHPTSPDTHAAITTLLNFSSDSLIAETFMSFLISFVIVTFSIFVAREMR
ncbi:hypothetical protein KP509_38G048500 [Ceratopteris richardii]|uniref:Uncharacterized protein n=1 Tax=Ceratopteris richardii TaxID=49495 RepID=A0A8T2Q3N2_CERRI|nr:hypothetical protein KP509_38G048500 [Ceratopteris richardii]